MHHLSAEMQACVDACLSCYQTCLSHAMGHCLEVGGQHVERGHFALLMSCVEICRIKEGDLWSCVKGSTRESAVNNGTVPAVMRVINLRA